MEIIEQIGSYAGLAAIVGLAILSALYFSQARDVRRLREAEEERAGAAPARAIPSGGPQRPGAAVPAAGAGAVATTPGGAQATPAKQAPAPAKATPAPASAAAAQAQPTVGGREENAQAAGVKEPVTPPAGAPAAGAEGASAAPAAPRTTDEKPAQAAAASQHADKPAAGTVASPPTPPPGVGATQRPIPRPAPLPAPRPGAARRLPPLPASTRAKPPWYRRLAPRYIVLLVAGMLVLGAGAAFGIATLAGGGDEVASGGAGDERAAGGDASAPLDPSTIEVAVLNGTSISGAAESVSDTVEQAGFQIGNVANATEQTSAESAVLFAEGARSAAREVGRELGISQLEPVDADTQSLAGTADVVVVVGADQAE